MQTSKHEQHVPHESEKPLPNGNSADRRSPGATRPGLADEDKLARTGKIDEPVRNTPPAGRWNDVGSNE
jgi:hypothetical protein